MSKKLTLIQDSSEPDIDKWVGYIDIAKGAASDAAFESLTPAAMDNSREKIPDALDLAHREEWIVGGLRYIYKITVEKVAVAFCEKTIKIKKL